METQVESHYGSEGLETRIREALKAAGSDPDRLLPKELSTVDQLHTGGHMATLELARQAQLTPGSTVLDAGCGIGGTPRLLAMEFGCRVIGIDLVPEFVAIARTLTASTGLDGKVEIRQGDIARLDLDDNSVDAVWCQHTLMNLKENQPVFHEFRRVLKPGGILVLHEILQGTETPIHLPVPWAATHDISFLVPWETMTRQLEQAGFRQQWLNDQTPLAASWWDRVKAAFKETGRPPGPLGPHLIFGDNGLKFGRTMSANIAEGRIQVMAGIFGS